eukprot:7337360-Prymnesium_polylepis.1
MLNFNNERLMLAAQSEALARACYDEALECGGPGIGTHRPRATVSSELCAASCRVSRARVSEGRGEGGPWRGWWRGLWRSEGRGEDCHAPGGLSRSRRIVTLEQECQKCGWRAWHAAAPGAPGAPPDACAAAGDPPQAGRYGDAHQLHEGLPECDRAGAHAHRATTAPPPRHHR